MEKRTQISGSLVKDTEKRSLPFSINDERDEVLEGVISRTIEKIEAVFEEEPREAIRARLKVNRSS